MKGKEGPYVRILQILVIVTYLIAYVTMTEKERAALLKGGLKKGFLTLSCRAAFIAKKALLRFLAEALDTANRLIRNMNRR